MSASVPAKSHEFYAAAFALVSLATGKVQDASHTGVSAEGRAAHSPAWSRGWLGRGPRVRETHREAADHLGHLC